MKEIKCPHCPGRPPFSKEANLKRHIQYMHLKEYQCPDQDCSEIFPSRKELIEHEKEKHRLKCKLCTKFVRATFKTQQQLRRHIKLVHEKQKRHESHFCNVCKLPLRTKTEYQLHLVKKHRSQGSGFEILNTAMGGDHIDYRKVINTVCTKENLHRNIYFCLILLLCFSGSCTRNLILR